MKKNIENSDAPTRSPTMLAPVSVRRRKIRNGISGAAERSSIATKAAISAAESPRSPSVWADPHPASVASTIAYTSSERPAVTLTAPALSKWRVADSERLSPITLGANAATTSATGTLIHSTHSQPRPSVRMPPNNTPAAPPAPATAPHAPSALLRSDPSLKVVVMIERADGDEQEPGEEHAPAPEQVCHPSAEQQEAAEGEHVGVDDPGEVLLGEVEALADRGQSHVDDRGVQHDYELRKAEE